MNRDELRARVEEILAEQAAFAPSSVGFGSGYAARGRKRSVAAPMRRASMRAIMPKARASARGRAMMAGECATCGGMLVRKRVASKSARRASVTRSHSKAAKGVRR